MNARHTTHAHRQYLLGCRDFERLIQRAKGLCEICGPAWVPPRLHIDHDHGLGIWAVRGLLCSSCNGLIDRPGFASLPKSRRYLEHPFWKTLTTVRMTVDGPVHLPSLGAVLDRPAKSG